METSFGSQNTKLLCQCSTVHDSNPSSNNFLSGPQRLVCLPWPPGRTFSYSHGSLHRCVLHYVVGRVNYWYRSPPFSLSTASSVFNKVLFGHWSPYSSDGNNCFSSPGQLAQRLVIPRNTDSNQQGSISIPLTRLLPHFRNIFFHIHSVDFIRATLHFSSARVYLLKTNSTPCRASSQQDNKSLKPCL